MINCYQIWKCFRIFAKKKFLKAIERKIGRIYRILGKRHPTHKTRLLKINKLGRSLGKIKFKFVLVKKIRLETIQTKIIPCQEYQVQQPAPVLG